MSSCDLYSSYQCNGHGVCWPGYENNYCVCNAWWVGDQCDAISSYYWLCIIIAIVVFIKLALFACYYRMKYNRPATAAPSQRVLYTSANGYPTTNGVIRSQVPPKAEHNMAVTVGKPVSKS
ncbi:hypothetical protein FOZ63_017384 [Perkinsus olseni]|uniref:EGF-like domain-containing protein n=1 Tax=Perkinsus olseni TaxID=32597 RepID=A0A7J6TN25_PEROL|nr:hypothetical protein FOZ63_017384 [Perkinsus olseni]